MTQPDVRRRTLMTRAATGVLAALAAASLAGCATTAPGGGASQEALLQRATEFWKANQANDGVTAWKYEELSLKPGWTLQGYLKRDGITYDDAKVVGVRSIEGAKAVVDVQIVYSVPLLRMRNKSVLLQDEWVLVEGVWYHADRKSIL